MYFGSWQFFLNDWAKIFCVLSMLPNPCRKILRLRQTIQKNIIWQLSHWTCGGCRSCSFLFDRRIASCALLVQHCSVSSKKCFHCFLAVLCFVMAILYVNQRFYFLDSWCKIVALSRQLELQAYMWILLMNWIADWFLWNAWCAPLCVHCQFLFGSGKFLLEWDGTLSLWKYSWSIDTHYVDYLLEFVMEKSRLEFWPCANS